MSVCRLLLRKVCAFGVALGLVASSRAQIVTTFSPAFSPDWNAAGNWSLQALPGLGNLATINSSTVGVNSPTTVGGIHLNGGNLGGSSTLTITSTSFASFWTAGSLLGSGTLIIPSTGGFQLNGTADKTIAHGGQGFNGHILDNSGVMNWIGTGNLLMGDGAQILNRSGAEFRLGSDQLLTHSNSGNLGTFTNTGSFLKVNSSGTSTIDKINFVNNATVWAIDGTIVFGVNNVLTSNAGMFRADAGSTIQIAGTQTYNNNTKFQGAGPTSITGGNATFSGNILSDSLIFAGGVATGTATFSGTSLKWSGGSWLGSGTFAFTTGTLAIEGAGNKTLAHGGQGFNGHVVSISNAATWQDAGQILLGDGAGFLVNAGGTFTILNDSTFGYNGSGNIPFFNSNGTVTKQTGTGTTFFDRIDFTNTGTINLQSGTINVAGSGALFSNAGTVNISTGAKLELNATGGTSTGQYNLAFGGNVRLLGGTQTLDTGASVTGLGSFDILGGTLLVNGSATVGNIGLSPGEVQLLAGTLGGTGTLTVKNGATFTWQGGTMNGSGSLVIESGGSLDLISATSKFITHGSQGFNGHTISNFGNILWTGTGTLFGGDGAQVINQVGGLIEIQANSGTGYNLSGNAPTYTNHGLIRRSAGGGNFTFTGGPFNNSATGTLEVQVGTFILAGGGGTSAGTLSTNFGATLRIANPYTISGGKIVGTGTMQLTDAVTVSGNTSVGDPAFSQSGYLQLVNGGSILGDAVLSVTGAGGGATLEWNGGLMGSSGTTQILPGGTLLITGTNPHTFAHGGQGFNGRTIDNSGTILWVGTGNVLGGDGAVLNNHATFDVQAASTLGYSGSGNTMTFNNAGTFKKSNGGGTFIYIGGAFNNTGLVLVQNGVMRFGSGGTSTGGEFQALGGTGLVFSAPYTLQSASTISGSGISQISGTTLTIGGGAASQVTGILQLPFGSTINGSGILEVSGQLQWTGGSMLQDGITRILPAGQLLLSGTDPKILAHGGQGFNGRQLQNAGLVSLAGTGNLQLGDQASITNQSGATFALEGTAGLDHNGWGVQGSFANTGLFIKRNDNGTASVTNIGFTNQGGGTITAENGILAFDAAFSNQAGTLNAFNGAKIVFNGSKLFNGGAFLGAGDIDVLSGTTALGGTITSQNLNFAGGVITGFASLVGLFEWSGGAIQGSSTLNLANSGTTLQITGGIDLEISHGSQGFNGPLIDNSGSILWTGAGNLRLGDAAQIVNRLNFVAQNDVSIGYSGSGNQPLFTNHGTFSKLSSSGTTLIGIPFNNAGSIFVGSGTLRFSSTYTHIGGTITLANDSTIAFDQGATLNTGILAGAGTVLGSVSTGATISPGAPIGTLFVDGSLTLLATSNLLIELGGTSQGVGYDLLDVNGAADLGGTLHLSFANNFQTLVTSGNTFTVLVGTGALGGSFSNIANGQRLATLDGIGSFQVNYGASSLFASNLVVLSDFAPIPEPSTWAMLGLGVGAVLFMVRRLRA